MIVKAANCKHCLPLNTETGRAPKREREKSPIVVSDP